MRCVDQVMGLWIEILRTHFSVQIMKKGNNPVLQLDWTTASLARNSQPLSFEGRHPGWAQRFLGFSWYVQTNGRLSCWLHDVIEQERIVGDDEFEVFIVLTERIPEFGHCRTARCPRPSPRQPESRVRGFACPSPRDTPCR
jgi:hypothetical protein